MGLDIEQREHEGIVILDLKGRITLGAESSALRDKVKELNDAGSHNLVLDPAHW